MSRAAAAWDRVVVAVLGLVLVAAGAAAIAWQTGRLGSAPDVLNASGAADLPSQGWWPAALAVAGVVLVLLGLRWLGAHLPGRRVHDVRVPDAETSGSGTTGVLQVDLSSVAAAAASAIEADVAVRSARGAAVDDRGRRTLELVVTADPACGLTPVAHAVERTLAQLTTAIGPRVAVRVRIRVARSARPTTRVA